LEPEVDQPASEEVEEYLGVDAARRWPFSIARAFSYTRMLERRIEELEDQLTDAESYITHLANMGLAMRGIPPPRQQRRSGSSSSSIQRRPVTMSTIRAKHKQKFRERHETQNSSSQKEEEKVISSTDADDIQQQINAVVGRRTGNG